MDLLDLFLLVCYFAGVSNVWPELRKTGGTSRQDGFTDIYPWGCIAFAIKGHGASYGQSKGLVMIAASIDSCDHSW